MCIRDSFRPRRAIREISAVLALRHHHRNHVEAKLAGAQLAITLIDRQPHLGQTADLVLFAQANRLEGVTAAAAQAGFDFDESDDQTSPGNDVYLTVTAAKVGLDDGISVK